MFSFLLEGSQIYEEEVSELPPLLSQSLNLRECQEGQGTAPNTPAPLDTEKKSIEFSYQNFISEPDSSKKSKHTNPNLIKNLVVTIREWVNFNHYPEDSLVHCLWSHFAKSNKINKTLLLLLYSDEKITTRQYRSFLETVSDLDKSCTLESLLTAQ